MAKVALITGVTGQDGAYLAELLLEKGYIVHGLKRRSSMFNTDRIDHLYQDKHEKNVNFFLHYGDLTDSTNLIRLVSEIKPDEIYNLAAQSHVKVSFETPEYTANADAVGTLRLLEAIRILGLEKKPVFTKLPLRSYMVWFRKFLKEKLPHSTLEVLMELQNFMHSGSQRTIVRLTECLLAMVSYSTTKAHYAVKPLLQER